MNERIRLLAQQAGIVTEIWKQDAEGHGYKVPNYAAEKFAELIVKECAKEIIRQNHNIASTEWEEGYEAGFQTASTVILKHFGVEE